MNKEFEISFRYYSQVYLARVIKSVERNRKYYAVRPQSMILAKGYGPQVLIFKENEKFNCESIIVEKSPEYVKALIEALELQDSD